MMKSHACWEDTEQCSPMCCESLCNVGNVPRSTRPNDPEVLSVGREGDFLAVERNFRNKFRILDTMIILIFGKSKKTCLVRNKLDVVLVTVLDRDEEEIREVSDVIGDQHGVIREGDTRNSVDSVTKFNTKLGKLGGDCLLIVINFILV